MVTPDAQRTMSTFLGAASEIDARRRRPRARSRRRAVTFLEGYLFDQPDAKEAFRQAARLAHDAGNRVALTLSDRFCVERHRADFLNLVEHQVDVLFANEHEIRSLYEVDDFDAAVAARSRPLRDRRAHPQREGLGRSSPATTSTSSTRIRSRWSWTRPAPATSTPPASCYGLARGHDLATCGRLGALAAAEVISHLGARPEMSLAELAAAELELA